MGLDKVIRAVQPEVTPGESPEQGSSQTRFVESAQQFVLRIPFGMPPPVDENLCFRCFPRDHHQNVAVWREPRTQSRKRAQEVLLGKIFEHRSRNDQVVVCPRWRKSFEGEDIDLLKLHSGDAT